KARVLAEAMS
nr:Chain P, CA-P2 SUBSTRATE [synthetic construct]1MT8_P Chain P, Capsid-p2 substrate peptide of HIV-1 Gag polyprotein [synthetic construct]